MKPRDRRRALSWVAPTEAAALHRVERARGELPPKPQKRRLNISDEMYSALMSALTASPNN